MTRNQHSTIWTKKNHIPIAGLEYDALVDRYTDVNPQPTPTATDLVEPW